MRIGHPTKIIKHPDNAVLIAKFRLEHRDLTDNELDKLVKRTFKIDRATLREMDGVGDYFSQQDISKLLYL